MFRFLLFYIDIFNYTNTMEVSIFEADYGNPRHLSHIKEMTNVYARDDMGGGEPLSDKELNNMLRGLVEVDQAVTFLACSGNQPVGIANCFVGFSTFEARPVINIHDFAVVPEYRRRGVGMNLLEAIQRKARKLKCCRLTLEVRSDNIAAQHLYKQFGFERGSPPMWFMTKEFY